MSLDLLGCDEIGFDYASLIPMAAGLAEGGITMYQQHEAEQKSAQDASKAYDTAIKADLAAASAIANADVASQLKKSAGAEVAKAKAAIAAATAASGGLSPSQSSDRIAAARKSLADAQKSSKAKPSDGYLKAYAKAWDALISALTGGGPAEGDGGGKGSKHDSESWLTRRVIGPIPGYGVLVGGAGILGIIGLIVGRLVKK